jgi:hypothetical protein
MPVKNQIQFLSLVAKELPDPFLGIHLAEGIELREIAFTRCPLYPPKADIAEHHCDVRFVPKADSCSAAKRGLFEL